MKYSSYEMKEMLINYLHRSKHKLRTLLISYVLAQSLLILLAILLVARVITTLMGHTTEDTEIVDAN